MTSANSIRLSIPNFLVRLRDVSRSEIPLKSLPKYFSHHSYLLLIPWDEEASAYFPVIWRVHHKLLLAKFMGAWENKVLSGSTLRHET